VLSPQAMCLTRHISMLHIFGVAEVRSGQDYGNAVFSRFPVKGFENYDLTVKGRERRQCLRAEISIGETSVNFFAVHLGTSFFERRKQAAALVSEEVLERPDVKGTRIVTGDFNEWTRGLATRMLTRHLESADLMTHLGRTRTYPGVAPFMHLDHIYYDPVFHLTAMHLHRSRAALVGSDHLPLVADFELRL
jgi:endonuclease/exonuclease/phosphatase family metal-dependent hydrolase